MTKLPRLQEDRGVMKDKLGELGRGHLSLSCISWQGWASARECGRQLSLSRGSVTSPIGLIDKSKFLAVRALAAPEA
jgi:hypothetical protein